MFTSIQKVCSQVLFKYPIYLKLIYWPFLIFSPNSSRICWPWNIQQSCLTRILFSVLALKLLYKQTTFKIVKLLFAGWQVSPTYFVMEQVHIASLLSWTIPQVTTTHDLMVWILFIISLLNLLSYFFHKFLYCSIIVYWQLFSGRIFKR